MGYISGRIAVLPLFFYECCTSLPLCETATGVNIFLQYLVFLFESPALHWHLAIHWDLRELRGGLDENIELKLIVTFSITYYLL